MHPLREDQVPAHRTALPCIGSLQSEPREQRQGGKSTHVPFEVPAAEVKINQAGHAAEVGYVAGQRDVAYFEAQHGREVPQHCEVPRERRIDQTQHRQVGQAPQWPQPPSQRDVAQLQVLQIGQALQRSKTPHERDIAQSQGRQSIQAPERV